MSYRGGGVVEMYSVVVSLLWYKEDMSQRGISSMGYILRLFQFFLCYLYIDIFLGFYFWRLELGKGF